MEIHGRTRLVKSLGVALVAAMLLAMLPIRTVEAQLEATGGVHGSIAGDVGMQVAQLDAAAK